MEAMLNATAVAEDRHFWFRGLRRTASRWLDQALAGRRDARILDCGCGTGRNLDWLTGYGDATGVELAPAGLTVARAHARRVVRGTVTSLPFADACADVATSFDVLYCLTDDEERTALAEMRRVLRPGGYVLVNVAALDLLRGSHSTLTMEQRRYTTARLRNTMESAGLRVERMSYTNFVTFPLTLAVRTTDRLLGRAGEASTADLTVPPAPVNAALDALLAMEAVALARFALPIGSSVLALARR